jgi:ketosteroid isomerase-like protein
VSLKRHAPHARQLKNGGDAKRKAMLGRFVGAWNAHDLDGIMASLTDDCVFWSSSGAHPQGGVSKTGKR